ncbi:MAG TPA: cytochrome c biogenesis protein CcdA [Gemmatimonadota bacterium]|nr:cytochrome c biogenesis protein CcdA [Gemmatimonadota bacterium]
MDSIGIGVFVAFLAGVLSFLSPCVLPLVPSYLSFVAGVGLEELEEGGREARRTVLLHATLFVLGFSLVFMGMGASASLLGRVLRDYQTWIARIGGVIVIVFGLHLLGVTPLRFLLRERRVQLRDRPVGMVGSVVVGVAFGAGWTPCIGPVLGGILTYAATRERLAEGVGLLAVYSAGLAIPFLIAAAALSRFLTASRRFRRYLPWVERVSGALLVAVGLLLVSGQFTVLAAWAARFTPEFLLKRI